MGWTGGELRKPFTALAAIEFDLGEDFARRVIDTATAASCTPPSAHATGKQCSGSCC
jgi:hypothetical protein